MRVKVQYIKSEQVVNVRRVSMRKVNMTDYVQELLANLVEAVVEMHELPNGDMSMDQGAELVRIGDRLAKLLNEFVEDKTC